LISENQRDEDDILNYYNPNPAWTHSDYGSGEDGGTFSKENVNVQTKADVKEWPVLADGSRPIQFAPHGGIVPIRRSVDTKPEMDDQLYQPLNAPNQTNVDDIKAFYNPNKQPDYHTYA